MSLRRCLCSLCSTISLAGRAVASSLWSVVGDTRQDDKAVPQDLDENVMPYQCACNSTYILGACCGSKDGIVHPSEAI